MRLLIIAGTPGLLAVGNKYNGGGWIASLQEKLLEKYGHIIDMALVHFNSEYADTETSVCRYYSVPLEHRLFINYYAKERRYKRRIKTIVDKEQPDIILCFGTEMPFALVKQVTNVPVVLHIQGLLQPITEFLLPHGMSWFGYLRTPKRLLTYQIWKKNCDREQRMLSSIDFILGRTEWDRVITEMIAPQAKYFYCSEILRPTIYYSKTKWTRKYREKRKIVSIISTPFYKGADVILRCANVLTNYLKGDFEWDVYGLTDARDMEHLTGITPRRVNVFFRGIVSAEQIISLICDADVFVHPSYIENSPNTVCEAQLLGIPVVATDVGGTSSIIKHRENGLLVPSNDIYLMAAYIKNLFDDAASAERLGNKGRLDALERHNPDTIVDGLVDVFEKILNGETD